MIRYAPSNSDNVSYIDRAHVGYDRLYEVKVTNVFQTLRIILTKQFFSMSRMVLDGRADDKSMILVLTGNDVCSSSERPSLMVSLFVSYRFWAATRRLSSMIRMLENRSKIFEMLVIFFTFGRFYILIFDRIYRNHAKPWATSQIVKIGSTITHQARLKITRSRMSWRNFRTE